MSDLINRDKIIQAICKNPDMSPAELYSIIIDATVEFDVDKVVGEIKDIMKDEKIRFVEQSVSRAVKIVKGAVKDE